MPVCEWLRGVKGIFKFLSWDMRIPKPRKDPGEWTVYMRRRVIWTQSTLSAVIPKFIDVGPLRGAWEGS